MIYPENYRYSKSHEWVLFEEDGAARIGLTDYAQKALGDLDSVTAGEPFGDVESVKAVSDVYSPVTGIVEEINEELLDSPELINSEANEAWLVKVRDITDQEELMDAAEYEAFVESLGE